MKKNKLLIILFILKITITYAQKIKDIRFEESSSNPVLMSNTIAKYLAFEDEGSRRIIDSLKAIDRAKFKKDAIGIWKFIGAECSCCVPMKGKRKVKTKYIKIDKDSIYFYEGRMKKRNLVRVEKIVFTNQFAYFYNLIDLVFKDKSLWSLRTDVSNNFLQIYLSGKETENGRTGSISGLSYEYYKRIM